LLEQVLEVAVETFGLGLIARHAGPSSAGAGAVLCLPTLCRPSLQPALHRVHDPAQLVVVVAADRRDRPEPPPGGAQRQRLRREHTPDQPAGRPGAPPTGRVRRPPPTY